MIPAQRSEPVDPVDVHRVQADELLVRRLAARRPVPSTPVNRELARWCAEVDADLSTAAARIEVSS